MSSAALETETLGDWLQTLAQDFAKQPALHGESDSLTFEELDTSASSWAIILEARQLGPGAHIGLLAGNSPQWLAAAFGIWRAGATLVPLSTFATERELVELALHADLDALILQPQLRGRDLLSIGKTLWNARSNTSRPLRHTFALEPQRPVEADSQRRSNRRPAGPACILYTSGTTGQPKGVVLSHRGILATVLPTARRGGLGSQDVMLSSLPLFWVAGLVIRALPTLASGAALVLMETFTDDVALDALERHTITALHLRPPQVGQLIRHRRFTARMLANVRRGGGRSEWFAPHLEQAQLITGYGMTEMSGYVTALSWDEAAQVRAQGIGAPLPHVELRIVAADGSPCPAGTTGEIQVRGPGLYLGYYKEPPGKGLTADGWFATGDLGDIDANGTFHFSGRSKDLLRVKGVNVSPLEVEAVLASHPLVEAGYVVGLPPDGLEQEVVALVVPKSRALTVDALSAWVREQLSAYKRPAHYFLITRADVPLGGTSKPQRHGLAQLAENLRATTA